MSERQGVRHERNENPRRQCAAGRKGKAGKIKRKSRIDPSGGSRRNDFRIVISKALNPVRQKSRLKSLLHRKAADLRRFFETALTPIEASSIFDTDESARFNF